MLESFQIIYYVLTVRVVSTSGAQVTRRIFGNKVITIMGVSCTNGIPALVKGNVIVTFTYLFITPNGIFKIIKTPG